MKGQKDLRTMKKEVNYIENQGNNYYKMFQNDKMTVFANNLDQLNVKLSLKLNVTETNSFFFFRGEGQ